MSKPQFPPALQLSWNLKTPDARHDEDLGLGNDGTSSSLWGVPLKYISLVTLAVQNSALTIIMHYSRISTPPSRTYSAATAVLMNEILKGVISLIIAFTRTDPLTHPHDSVQAPYHVLAGRWTPTMFSNRVRRLFRDIFSPDCWKLSIPAILYVIQNNLQYVAASNLDAATFQVTYQMKILTTAAFSVILLRRKLSPSQWLALLFLAIGVGTVQIQSGASKVLPAAESLPLTESHKMSGMKGFAAVALACSTSGLAGVYFEMVLKNTQTNLWVRNVQLSLFSLLPALAPIILSHAQSIDSAVPQGETTGWFSTLFCNFGLWAWATVAVQVLGGLITAMVIKYSDNILKGFATSLSIVLSFLASVALFDFDLTVTFILGSVIVLIATWLYNQPTKRASSNIGLTLSSKDSTVMGGWHLPLSTPRVEKTKGDLMLSRPPTPPTLQSNQSSVSSSGPMWSLSSTPFPLDSSCPADTGGSLCLDRQYTIYTR
ncbi:hypothetical protein AX17_003512 [Amanita inopinata Kibby_2008]|nr:hypothetical protein AX17_003512 [Amanita inopinata Kibby_2008]